MLEVRHRPQKGERSGLLTCLLSKYNGFLHCGLSSRHALLCCILFSRSGYAHNIDIGRRKLSSRQRIAAETGRGGETIGEQAAFLHFNNHRERHPLCLHQIPLYTFNVSVRN